MADNDSGFEVIGVDLITLVCYDRHFWREKLERFGFDVVRPFERVKEEYYGTAMTHGASRFLLIDPTNKGYSEELVREFIIDYGDMQVFSVAIEVSDIGRAVDELLEKKENFLEDCAHGIEEDVFGRFERLCLCMPEESVAAWTLVKRSSTQNESFRLGEVWKSTGVDHFAIAVDNLDKFIHCYTALGFKTIYVPKVPIEGRYSGMKTIAMRRGPWTVALVEGEDRVHSSQVSTYRNVHGNHSIQHIALGFKNLPLTLEELRKRETVFRLRRVRDNDSTFTLDDIMHQGEDHSGALLQCFTKPWARKLHEGTLKGGLFFELIQRFERGGVMEGNTQAFHDPTVIGLYESIEREELCGASDLIFPQKFMQGYRFSEWLRKHQETVES